MSAERNLQKVVVRTRTGEVSRGFGDPRQIQGRFSLVNTAGNEETFSLDSLKAIFMVKNFGGDPGYKPVQWLARQTGSAAVWVRLRFFDDEEMEGRIQNNLGLLRDPGFFLWPSDADSNNQCAYIVKAALKDFTILSAD